MFGKKLATVLVAGMASMALPAFSQSEGPTSRQEVAVQAFGSFVKGTTQNGIENKATNSGGVLGSYRYFFSAHHGIEANYGYALNTQKYGSTGLKSNSHEVSGAYVFRYPLGKLTPFASAGVGALIFQPRDMNGVNNQTRAAFVYGAGADYNITHHVFLRAEYRGFVYNSPTWNQTALSNLDRVTHRAEPSIGFGYRF